MKKADPVRKLELLSETYWSANQIYEMYPGGITWARNLVKEIIQQLEDEGIETFKTKVKYVPKSKVLERHPIDKKALQDYVAAQNKNA